MICAVPIRSGGRIRRRVRSGWGEQAEGRGEGDLGCPGGAQVGRGIAGSTAASVHSTVHRGRSSACAVCRRAAGSRWSGLQQSENIRGLAGAGADGQGRSGAVVVCVCVCVCKCECECVCGCGCGCAQCGRAGPKAGDAGDAGDAGGEGRAAVVTLEVLGKRAARPLGHDRLDEAFPCWEGPRGADGVAAVV